MIRLWMAGFCLAMSASVWAQGVTDGRPGYTTDLTLPAGDYRLTLGDAQFPRAFASLTAGVLSGTTVIASLEAAGDETFTSDGSVLTLRVFAQTQAPEVVGTATVTVRRVDNEEVVFEWLDALEDEQPDGPGVAEAMTFELPTAQDVTIDLGDFAVPADLADFDVIVLDASFMEVARLPGPGTATVSLPAGEYQLFSAATADVATAEGNGVFRINVAGSSDGMLINDLNVVGDDIEVQTVVLSAGDVSLNANDVGFPVALDTLSAALIGDDAFLDVSLTDPSATGTVAGGTYQLFVYGGTDAASGGTYSVNVESEGSTVTETVNVVNAQGSTGPRLTESFSVAGAGNYQLTVTDFRFPAGLQGLSTVVVGPDGLVTTLEGEGSVAFDVAPGDYQVLVAASGTSGQDGLFGVTLNDGSAVVLESTAGTATGGETGIISASAGQRVTVTLSDIGFPANFASLSLAVTRGSETVGFVFGAGSFFFDVTETGDFQYTLLATPDATAGAGLYDIAVSQAATPPPPQPDPDPPAPTPPEPPGGSGGGGVFGPWMVLALFARRRLIQS